MSNATFSRASSKWVRNELGVLVERTANIAGFDYISAIGRTMNLIEPSATNLALYSRDLSNAVWVKTNATATLTATGANGVSNSASVVTATGANATVIQSITSASSARRFSAYVKRRTGTGTIEMTQDNGATWTAISVTSAWTRFSVPSQTLTNPNVGFRIVTSGDAIDVDFTQAETGTRLTSPIVTTATTATRNRDDQSKISSPALIGQQQGMIFAELYLEYIPVNGQAIMDVTQSTSTTQSRISLYTGTSNNVRLALRKDASNVVDSGASGLTGSLLITGYNKVLVRYNSTGAEVYVNGVLAGSLAFAVGYNGLNNIYWGSFNNGTSHWNNHLGLAFPSPYYPTAAEAIAWTTL